VTRYRSGLRSFTPALEHMRDELAPDTLLAEVQRVWPAVVGEAIAAEASPAREHGGVLTISCSASVWAQELDLMGAQIVERLNANLRRGKVDRLRCVAVDLRRD
jgi:predicted nucleic acid-binding Zn ribbon protein